MPAIAARTAGRNRAPLPPLHGAQSAVAGDDKAVDSSALTVTLFIPPHSVTAKNSLEEVIPIYQLIKEVKGRSAFVLVCLPRSSVARN